MAQWHVLTISPSQLPLASGSIHPVSFSISARYFYPFPAAFQLEINMGRMCERLVLPSTPWLLLSYYFHTWNAARLGSYIIAIWIDLASTLGHYQRWPLCDTWLSLYMLRVPARSLSNIPTSFQLSALGHSLLPSSLLMPLQGFCSFHT